MSQYFAAHPEATNQQMLDAFYASLNDGGTPGADARYGQGVFDDLALQRFLAP